MNSGVERERAARGPAGVSRDDNLHRQGYVSSVRDAGRAGTRLDTESMRRYLIPCPVPELADFIDRNSAALFANILARPLISLAQGLTSIMAPGGHLILSGLTRDQVRWVVAAYRNRGLVLAHTLLLGNWATLVLSSKRKRPKHIGAGRLVFRAVGVGW